MNVAVIPARGGSKRIPRKNVKPFCGKPMIAWSIESAIASQCFDRIIVSTDDKEIAEISKRHGAEVPFMRPPELSDDYTGTNDVVVHAVDYLQSSRVDVQYVACIYATAPFLTPQKIVEGMEILRQSPEADYAVTVTNYSYPVQRALIENEKGEMVLREPENALARSQDMVACYHDAAQLYVGRPASFKRHKTVFLSSVVPVYLHPKSVQDIDSPEDWEKAELMFKLIGGQDNA